MLLSGGAVTLLQHATSSSPHSLPLSALFQQLAGLHQLSRLLHGCAMPLQQVQQANTLQHIGSKHHQQLQQPVLWYHATGRQHSHQQPLHRQLAQLTTSYQTWRSCSQLLERLGRECPWQGFKHACWGRGGSMMHQRSMHSTARLPVEKLQEVITPAVCNELSAKGYAVVDGVFGAITSHQLALELMHVWQQGLMHLNHTHLVNKRQTTLLAKSQVMEAELSLDPHIREAAPLVAQLDADRRLQTMLNLFIPQLRLEAHAIKMQHNIGSGGCFPMHFDSDELLDGRRVTAIFYLNQEWKPSHGGELRLYPFPAPPVDIPPLNDRLVLFASTRMLHRVLPSRVPRSCFTIWLSQGRTKAAGVSAPPMLPPPAAGQPGDELWHFLMQPAIRQHVCKLAYADEWEQSIKESHPDCSATGAALEKHRQEVTAISKALSKFQPGLQQLLSAAALVQSARAATAEQESADKDGGRRRNVTDEQLQEAVKILRQVAAHVKWF